MSDSRPNPPAAPNRKAEGRRSIRFPTRFAGELRAEGRRIAVSIRDISREGVMIEGEGLPRAGRAVSLVAEALDVDARVIWQRDALCGLEFLLPIEPLEIVRRNLPELARFKRPEA